MISRKLNSDCNVQLFDMLKSKSRGIIEEANEALARMPLKHYKASSVKKNRERFTNLLSLTSDAIKSKNLIPMIEYAQQIAKERFKDNFGLQEIQIVFNILEEIIWENITDEIESLDYPEAFGLASTVLGAGKEAMAGQYISLASKRKDIQSLNLNDFFNGM